MRRLSHGLIRSLPWIALFLGMVVFAAFVARLAARLAGKFLEHRIATPLLSNVTAKALGFVVFLFGLYLAMQIAGLTNIAVTVLGGTGIVGLILGIAFRDITENFLASIFLSLQRPFRLGDLVEIQGTTGYVHQLNTRTTVLMNQSGNHVQIPNATVFKSTIRNFTSNPNRREEFVIGIGYEDRVAHAQEIALRVLAAHPAVLKSPEPWVLVDRLGSATVDLKVYFWLDGSVHHYAKVRSALMRLIKRAFQDAGISMPDPQREVIFPKGIPLATASVAAQRRPAATAKVAPVPRPARPARPRESDNVATRAEGGLESNAAEIRELAESSRSPDEGANTLTLTPNESEQA
jgi:small-conductance mechanosensitive channel